MQFELMVGPSGAFSEEELARGWHVYGSSLHGPGAPGRRAWAWWKFEAGRPEHELPQPDVFGAGDEEQAAAEYDEWAAEPFFFLAENGHLTDSELAALVAAGKEAHKRLGTDRQRGTLLADGVWLGGDRTTAAIARAVEEGAR